MGKCHGIITDDTCGICGCTVCKKCREIIKNDSHQCDAQTIASIRAILNDAHPCPKCATPISKISGCDQMFCTQCHATFSWNTGAIITHRIHNPHYFEWLLERQFQQPTHLGNACEEYISHEKLLECFTEDEIKDSKNAKKNLISLVSLTEELPSVGYYIIAFINMRQMILDVRSNSGNHVNTGLPDNHDIRIKLLAREIDENNFKNEIEKRDFEFKKNMCYWEIYSHVSEIATILFDNLYIYCRGGIKIKKMLKKNKSEFLYETYVNLQKILEYANHQLAYNNKVFGSDKRLVYYQPHPFVV